MIKHFCDICGAESEVIKRNLTVTYDNSEVLCQFSFHIMNNKEAELSYPMLCNVCFANVITQAAHVAHKQAKP